ncbi:TPA: lysine--tRNA ligase [Candidatus Woesearchaeota archaeon]|nr:Lysine-tRNA ligase [archaeon GW2011_AR15]MBS3103647.1 lysine--tRNA ligase [Candidatus Woesearchaeota archaeon]HIH41752.1 lysine--tRNA ligase [Candidatus Woesearchaeota archaeon]
MGDLDVNHWADQIADEVIERVEKDSVLKKQVAKTGYFIYDEKTPSGVIHIGSGRGWVIHDAIAKALKDKGKKARFVLSSDDMDPLDKPSKELSKEDNEKYIGIPFRYIPSPVKGYKNFGEYYFRQCTDLFPRFGIEAELESTGEEYEKGTFNKAIKTALDNADKVQKVYAELYGEDVAAANKLPFNVKCPKCGKIATTLAIEWDRKKEEIYFECSDKVVEWAKGCGHKGWISPYNGNGKFPWKVEWAAKWPSKGVIAETAGKDHFTKGGSRTIACRISVDVFNYPPPYPSNGYYTGQGYEFFTVGGKKMSTSKGRGIGFAESVNFAPAKMLRFLLIRTRPNAVIDFDPYGTNDIILLYERYDTAERVYFGKQDLGEKENIKQKRIYELSHIGKIPTQMPPQISLVHAATLVQIFDSKDDIIENLKQTGHIKKGTTKESIDYVKDRLDFAEKWVKEFADEQYRFELQKKAPDVKLDAKQVKAIRTLAKKLREKEWDEKSLYDEFYNIARDEAGIEPKELFTAAYLVLLNRERGPKLAPFLLAAKEKAIKLFEAI